MPPQHLRSSTFRKKTRSFCRQERQSLSAEGLFSDPFSPHHQQSASHLTSDKLLPKDLTSFGLILGSQLETAVLHLTGLYPIYPISWFLSTEIYLIKLQKRKTKKDILLVIHNKNYPEPRFFSPDMLFPRNESLGSRDDHVCPVRAWSLRLLASVRLCNKHRLWSHRLNLLWGHSIYIHVL